MNCEINCTSCGLVAYYHFNNGTAGGTNTGLNTASDASGNGNTGTLYNFALSGSTSNWVAPGAVTSGNTCLSVVPNSCTANPANICPGSSSTINLNGGTLASGANWYWYTGSCGGTYIISGSSPTLSPTSTTTFWVRAEGTANTTSCVSITVTILTSPTVPSQATATPTIICNGGNAFLNASCSVGIIRWWNSPTGGSLLGKSGSGSNFFVSPTVSTVYYAEAYAPCGVSSSRLPDTLIVSGLPTPTSATVSPGVISCGAPISLSALSSSNFINWYTTASGGTPVGTSESGTNLVLSPTSTTTYYAESVNGTPAGSQSFNYSGSIVTWSVPSAITSITIDARGASGGNVSGYTPGYGAQDGRNVYRNTR